ncbi:gamma-secretase subunit APH-1B-like [Artemia franciscana]|uniref:gamma-secretase subunit APH-1B-like n=1 Tax=Artemia franciscana TaxID=6661 RepID=UPI0032D9F0F5
MTAAVFFGCAMLAFGPPLALFLFTVADDAVKIILLIASSFFWLVSHLLTSAIWLIVKASTSDPAAYLSIGVIISVLLQETFRFLLYLVLKRAEKGLKKLTEDENHVLLENKNVLAYGK